MGFTSLLRATDKATREILADDLTSITYTSGLGVAVVVTGIFDDAYTLLDLGQPGVATTGPGVFLDLASLSSDPETDREATITVGVKTYKAHTVMRSGPSVTLHLHES